MAVAAMQGRAVQCMPDKGRAMCSTTCVVQGFSYVGGRSPYAPFSDEECPYTYKNPYTMSYLAIADMRALPATCVACRTGGVE